MSGYIEKTRYSENPSPTPGTEWVVRYRVRGPSAVWDGMTVCEVVGGPMDGQVQVLNNDRFVDQLEKKRRARVAA